MNEDKTLEELNMVNEGTDFQDKCDIICSLMSDELYVPMRAKELAILLNISKGDRGELHKVLDTLVERGKIICSSNGKYIIAEDKGQSAKTRKRQLEENINVTTVERDNRPKVKKQGEIVVGTFINNVRGFGFVDVEGEDEDVFIGKDYVGDTFHGDKVEVEIFTDSKGDSREGRIVNVLSHEITTVVGTYEKSKNYGFVVCDNTKIGTDIFIPQGKDMRAVNGHKVVVQITKYAKKGNKPEGVITEILGHKNDPGVDIISMIKAFGVPTEFPGKVMNQATNVSNPVSEADMAGREDFRDVQMVTIDGEDAKDLDDAVSVTYDGTNYTLGVYIADVSNYVQENSALDKEAYKRGTSVYLVDRVIPMLPHTLSNGICSLNQGEDRLALCCIMTIDGKGNIIDHKICEGVVNVDRRMTYTAVAAILDGDEELNKEYEELVPMFQYMYTLSTILRHKRTRRGAIDFDMTETKIILDDQGKVTDIVPYDRNYACKIIEDFMLAANETVAEDFFWKECPFLYRTHGVPEDEKVRKLKSFVGKFGYVLKGDTHNMHPKEFQKILDKVKGKEEELLISRLTLRTMQQAKYTYENTGHFGLAAEYYCHFTSPIRRYPDLQIHRIIKENLRGRFDDKRSEHYEALLPVVATNVCKTERRAEELEREVDKLKKVQYMHQFLGDEFHGVISSITGFGFYVELANGVDGLVHISSLRDDYYHFDEDNYELIGERTNNRFSLGEEVNVRLVAADDAARTIDFELIV